MMSDFEGKSGRAATELVTPSEIEQPLPDAVLSRYDMLWRLGMRRREFIGGLAAAGLPLTARAQQAGRIPTIGVLWHAAGPSEEQPYFNALIQGFKELGYVEGRNIRFEHRFPNEMPDRFRQMAAELAALNVDTIVTVGNV